MKIYEFWAKWADGFEATGTIAAVSYKDCFRAIRLGVYLWNDVNYVILIKEVLQ